MKKVFLSAVVAIFAVCSLKAQIDPNASKPADPNAPEIKFESVVHDYGTLNKTEKPDDAIGDCEFKFTNVGKTPLIITNVRSSCGCTVPKKPEAPILPGKSEVIKVHYNTNRVGAINKQVTVESNAKNSPVILTIKGMVNDTAPKPQEEQKK